MPDRVDSPLETLRAVVAARRFYIDGATKSAIASELRVSRFKVARLIDRAVREKIITFAISEPDGVDVETSHRLAQSLQIPECVVVPVASHDPTARLLQVGTAAAQVVAGLLEEGETIGISWGRTLRALVDAMPLGPAVDFVQLVGGTSATRSGTSPADLVTTVAARCRGRAQVLHAPLLADNIDSAATLRSETGIAATFERFNSLDRAVIGIGSWDATGGSALRAALPDDVASDCTAAEAVADVCALLIGADGTVLQLPSLADRVLAISESQLRAVADVTAVAVGEHKATAVRAACASGLVHRLVTDSGTAGVLLGDDVLARPFAVSTVTASTSSR